MKLRKTLRENCYFCYASVVYITLVLRMVKREREGGREKRGESVRDRQCNIKKNTHTTIA